MSRLKSFFVKATLFFVFVAGLSALVIASLQNYEEIAIANEKYFSADMARINIDRMKLEANPYFANMLNSKLMNEMLRNISSTIGMKDLGKSLESYQDYILQRGSAQSLREAIESLRSSAAKLHALVQKEGFRAATDTIQLVDAIAELKLQNVMSSEHRVKDIQERVKILKDRFENVKIDGGVKAYIESNLGEMTSKLEYLQKRTAFIESKRSVVESFVGKMRVAREHLSDYQTMIQATIKNSNEHMRNLLLYTWVMTGLVILTLFRFWTSTKTEKVIIKEVVSVPNATIESIDLASNSNQFLVDSLQMGLSAPTVALDSNEKIIWASDSFFKTLKATFDRNKEFYWKDFINSKVIQQGGAVKINGAVRLITDPEKEYMMKANAVMTSKGEFKIIQFVPLMNYQLEVSKAMKDLERFKNIKLPNLHEMGDILEDVITKGNTIFQNSKTQISFVNDKPLFVALDKAKLVSSLTTLLSGIIFHLETQFGKQKVELSYDKDGDDTVIRFRIPDAKVDDVNNPTFFKGKTYPSLSSYLSQIEESLKTNKAGVTIKNVTSKKNGRAYGLIELSLKENQDTYLDTKELENKERVARAVSKAEKIKKAGTFKDFQ